MKLLQPLACLAIRRQQPSHREAPSAAPKRCRHGQGVAMNASVLHEASRLQKRANARVPLQAGKSHVLATFPLICWPPQPMEQFVPAH